MAFILSDVGAALLLDILLNDNRATGGDNLTLKLFATDVTPTDASVAGDFTVAAGGGYANKTLTMGSWTVNEDAIRNAEYAEQVFTFTGPLTTNPDIYGYYIIDADGALIGAELLDTPFTPAIDGDHLDIIAKIQCSKGTPT